MNISNLRNLNYYFLAIIFLSHLILLPKNNFGQEKDSIKAIIFSESEQLIQSARDENAPLLSPENFNNALDHFKEAEALYEEGESLNDIREELAISKQYLNKSIESAQVAGIILREVIEFRSKIISYRIYQYEPDDFNEAENMLKEAVTQIEEGDIDDAKSYGEEAKEIYSELAVRSLKSSMLESARELLDVSEDQITSERYDSADENLDMIEDEMEEISPENINPDLLYSEFYGKISESFFNAGIEVPLVGLGKYEDLLPDTLLMAGFILVVRDYTSAAYNRVSGIAEGFFIDDKCYQSITIIDSVLLLKDSEIQQSESPLKIAELNLSEINSIAAFNKRGLVFGTEINQDLLKNVLSKYSRTSSNSFIVNFENLKLPEKPGKKAKVLDGLIQQNFTNPFEYLVSDYIIKLNKITINQDSTTADISIRPSPLAVFKLNNAKSFFINIGSTGITNDWRISKSLPELKIDTLIIGNTGIACITKGVSVDFRPGSKRLIFHSGITIPQPINYPSNTGFLYGSYTFSNAEIIGCEGFAGKLSLTNPLRYKTLAPLNFGLMINAGQIEIKKSWIKDGQFSGEVLVPNSVVDQNGNNIRAGFTSLKTDSTLSLSGDISVGPNQKFVWNNFELTASNGRLFLPGAAASFLVTPLDTTYFAGYDSVKYNQMDIKSIESELLALPGLTINLFNPKPTDEFTIKTNDAKPRFSFNLQKDVILGWLNISTQGITGQLQSKEEITLIENIKYGRQNESSEKDSSFSARVIHDLKKNLWVDLKFVKNAVCDSYISGDLFLPYPCNFTANYNDLNVTSTAELVGGNVFFKEKMLDYWGVYMTAEDRGNILSVGDNEIVFLNSSITEPIHYSKPFEIVWGEIYGSGSLGKFIFDLNSNGQRFDGLPLMLHNAKLSEYNNSKPSANDTLGYLNTYGDLYFDLFGAHRMDILDYKDARPGHDKKPYYNRFATINKKRSALDIDKNWGSGTANMKFTVDYDHADQNGFRGVKSEHPMHVELNLSALMNASIIEPDEIDLNSYTSWIHFCSGGSSKIDLAVDQMAALTTIGGIILIKGDKLERFVLEGHASVKSFSYASQTEAHALASLTITPNTATLSHRGYLAFTGLNVQLFGLAATTLVLNKSEGSLEGTVMGVFQGASGLNYLVRDDRNKLEARGQFNFYAGSKAVYMQGYGDISVKFGVSINCEGAFYTGFNAPTKKIWVLDKLTRGPSLRGILTSRGINNLTGFYVGGAFSYGMDLGVIEGRYKLWGGLGYFLDYNGMNQILLGHGGVELSGSLLWGLVSGSAWAEVQSKLDLPVPNFYMSGTLGVEACVLFACTSWSGTLCISTDKGIQTGECN